jgi:hypothetical protein
MSFEELGAEQGAVWAGPAVDAVAEPTAEVGEGIQQPCLGVIPLDPVASNQRPGRLQGPDLYGEWRPTVL